MARQQGFDSPPHLVTEQKLAQYIEQGEIELFRGHSRQKYAEQEATGEYFAGTGIYGNGIYTASAGANPNRVTREARSEASGYLGHLGMGGMNHMTLKSGARTIIYEDASRQMTRDAATAISNASIQGQSHMRAAARIYSDVGRWAMAHGYDALVVTQFTTESVPYMVVLNRGALRVAHKSGES